MRLRRSNRSRRGASLVEAAFVLPVFLMLCLGTIDLGMAVFRLHILSQAARQGARQAIVHGSLARSGWQGGPWGPTTYGPLPATSSDPQMQAVASSLVGVDPAQAQITVEWPDGSNAPGKRVTVTVTTTWSPLMVFIFGNQTTTLSASSTMPIAH